MKNKYFIITIDTEADNQWNKTQKCTTNNSKFLPRFQELAEKYDFKPVWLTTYEMANDDFFVKFFKGKQDNDLCEIGMHLHAWNNPPQFELENNTNERSYLIEYPFDIMDKKIKTLDNLLTNRFSKKAISHRSGRWATDVNYFKLLKKYGYKVDCSVTPHIDWSNNVGITGMSGTDYSKSHSNIYQINDDLIEVPVTIKKIHSLNLKRRKGIINKIKGVIRFLIGKYQWVRPGNDFDFNSIKKVINKCNKNGEYIMFMIHSSELMPGGSPNFVNNKEIEKLYYIIENIFSYSKKLGYKGITLRDLYKEVNIND